MCAGSRRRADETTRETRDRKGKSVIGETHDRDIDQGAVTARIGTGVEIGTGTIGTEEPEKGAGREETAGDGRGHHATATKSTLGHAGAREATTEKGTGPLGGIRSQKTMESEWSG